MKCKKCGGEIKIGKALNNPTIEGSEGHGTQSQGNSNIIIEVAKCGDCGHSFVPSFANKIVLEVIEKMEKETQVLIEQEFCRSHKRYI
jgi:hypothetical protein